MLNSSSIKPVLIPIHSRYNNNNNDENHDPQHRSDSSVNDVPKKESHSIIPEYAMIEINGELLPPLVQPPPQDSTSIEEENDKQLPIRLDHGIVELGALQFVQGTPTLIIGTHELRGVIQDLAQPFCVLQKQKQEQTSQSNNNNPTMEKGNSHDPRDGTCRYEIAGVVRRKILFANYPKTLMR